MPGGRSARRSEAGMNRGDIIAIGAPAKAHMEPHEIPEPSRETGTPPALAQVACLNPGADPIGA